MEKSFKDCFTDLCASRAGDAVMMASRTNSYVEVLDNLNSVRKQVEKLVGPDLMIRLSDAYGYKQINDTNAAYEQGMRDGLRLNRIMGGACL